MKEKFLNAKTEGDRVDIIADAANRTYQKTAVDPYGRFRSWEHCYVAFGRVIKKDKIDDKVIDYLSLHLAFYLASWGMYRGSAAILQRDYRVHEPVVRTLLKPDYRELRDVSAAEVLQMAKDSSIEQFQLPEKSKLFRIYNEIKIIYDDVCKKVRQSQDQSRGEVCNSQTAASKTLVTKVLMGTLGCIPAYDRYVERALKELRVDKRSSPLNSVCELARLYDVHKQKFEDVRKDLKIGDDKRLSYPQMKLLDMGLWRVGLELTEDETGKRFDIS